MSKKRAKRLQSYEKALLAALVPRKKSRLRAAMKARK
jgi:hypothetical protein